MSFLVSVVFYLFFGATPFLTPRCPIVEVSPLVMKIFDGRVVRVVRFYFVLLGLILVGAGRPALAAPPTLTEAAGGGALLNVYQVGKPYTVRLVYTDPDGDTVKKAEFVDESNSGRVSFAQFKVENADPVQGSPIVWSVNGFEKGGHKGYFTVTNSVGEVVRFPAEGQGDYTFKVVSVTDQWIVFGVGTLISLIGLPYLFYMVARSTNKRGNPTSAARIGLLIGIFASLALFIYQFISLYDPLMLALGGVAFLALLIVVLTRK